MSDHNKKLLLKSHCYAFAHGFCKRECEDLRNKRYPQAQSCEETLQGRTISVCSSFHMLLGFNVMQKKMQPSVLVNILSCNSCTFLCFTNFDCDHVQARTLNGCF